MRQAINHDLIGNQEGGNLDYACSEDLQKFGCFFAEDRDNHLRIRCSDAARAEANLNQNLSEHKSLMGVSKLAYWASQGVFRSFFLIALTIFSEPG